MPYTMRALSTMPVPVVAMTDSAMESAMTLAQDPPPSTLATSTSVVPFSALAASLAGDSTPWKPTCARV